MQSNAKLCASNFANDTTSNDIGKLMLSALCWSVLQQSTVRQATDAIPHLAILSLQFDLYFTLFEEFKSFESD